MFLCDDLLVEGGTLDPWIGSLICGGLVRY